MINENLLLRSSWCDGSSDRSFVVDPLSYLSEVLSGNAGPDGAVAMWSNKRSNLMHNKL